MIDWPKNRRTVAAYDNIALQYAESTQGPPSGVSEAMMRLFADLLPQRRGAVLELGSGPGWDADFVESLGAQVRRTDASPTFCSFQTSRGKPTDRLDAITDDYTDAVWPSYDGVMAHYVLQHIERDAVAVVLHKVSAGLRTGGVFLVSVREGFGEFWETDASGNRYHLTLWEETVFEERLRDAGLEPTRVARTVDEEGPWLVVLARKAVDEVR